MPCGEGGLEETEQSGGCRKTDFSVWPGMQRDRSETGCQAVRRNKKCKSPEGDKFSLYSQFF